MHIRNKRQLLSMLNMLQSIQSKIQNLDTGSRFGILQKCQETAIVLGESIEKAVTEDLSVIPLLERYCEKIYLLSKKEKILSGDIEEINSILLEIQEYIENLPATYRVVFLPYKADMWDSLESIWKAFSQDDRFECHVVPIPYFEANQETKQWEPRYDGNRFPKYVPVTHFDYYSLEEMTPDIAFVHNPFDSHNLVTSVHPAFYSEELVKYVKKLIYVPYYVNTGFISSDYANLPLIHRASHMVVQSEMAKNSCKGQPYFDRILALGSPKLDKVINLQKQGVDIPTEWGIDTIDGKLLLLNTTINDLLYNDVKLIHKLKSFFSYIAEKSKVKVIWRPHPLLEATIKAMRPSLHQQYQEVVEYFVEKQVGILDYSGDISKVVVLTDAYIGSGYSSVINLFAVCGKPIFLFANNDNIYLGNKEKRIMAEEAFSKKTEQDYFAARECEAYTIEDFIDDLVNNRLEEVRVRQLEAVKDLAANLDGTCGQKVYEYLADEILNER